MADSPEKYKFKTDPLSFRKGQRWVIDRLETMLSVREGMPLVLSAELLAEMKLAMLENPTDWQVEFSDSF